MIASRPRVLMLFLDGVGIGTKDPGRNPFFAVKMGALESLLGGSMIHYRDARRSGAAASAVPLNTTLGVAGLPQSGTGQAALLTGLNAPKIIHKHFGPYLYSTLKPYVARYNIFTTLRRLKKRILYANAFPRQYFDYLDSGAARTPAIAYSWLSTGQPLNDAQSLSRGNAVSADITNQRWPKLGYPEMPPISPVEAGRRLVHLIDRYDFVLFEYYQTDHAGHSQSLEEATEILQKLDGLLEGILDVFDFDRMLLVLTSDHGNLEDLSVKTHTRNPVPLLAAGLKHREMVQNAKNLTHVMPAIMSILQ